MRILAFAAASLVAVAVATSGSASAETAFDLLPAHTVAAIRVRNPLRAVQALADVNPDEFAALSFAVSGGAAAAGLDGSSDFVVAVTLTRDTATPLQPFVGGALDIPNIALLALLPGKDVNALARALLAAGYRRDSPALTGAAVALTHARLPSLSLAQWAPGVIAATVSAPPLKDGDEVMGVSVCPSGCYVVAQEPDSIAVVEPKYWGSYSPGTRRESDLSYTHQRVHTRFLMPSGWLRENTGIESLAPLFAYNASVPPAPPKPAGEAAGSGAGTAGGAKAGRRLTEQLAPGLRSTLDNGVVSLLVHPLAAGPLLQPALGAVHAALPLARMALSLGLRGLLPGQPLSHATAAAAGAVLDTLAGALLTAAEQTETILLSVGPSTGFASGAAGAGSGSGSGSNGAAVADANDKLAMAAAALTAALPAGFRIETAVAVRADAPLGRAVAAAPVSTPWEDLLAGLPAQAAIPRADYLLVTADAASRGTSLDSWLAQQFAEATAPHVAALEAEADSSLFAQAALGALRGRDMLSSLTHTFEGAQVALLLPNQRLTDAPVDEAEVHGAGAVGTSALALLGASSPIAAKGEAASIFGAVALLAGNGTAAAAGVERWSDFIRESLMHVATHAQAPWANLLTVTQELSAQPAVAAPAPAATTAEAAVTSNADIAAVEPAAAGEGSGTKPTGRRQDAAFAIAVGPVTLRVAFETWPPRTVADNVQLERRVIRFNLTQQLPWAASAHVGSFYLDESWGVIPETGQCIVAGAVDDATIAAFIDAARARAAASAASAGAAAGAAAGASEGDAPSDSPFSDDAATAVPQPPSTSAESASAGAASGSSGGSGYSTDPAVAAATRATHPRKTGTTVVHLATIARALCRVLPFTGAGAGTAEPLLPPWLAPVCDASEAFLGASPPPVISASAEGAVLRLRLALAMPGAQNVAAMLRAWSASPN